ncbi:Protein HIRA [Operophtera brumata]|uniref:Protein HIRA n=1 Tax=Operophtera brumata TaxID=104452 RepID=A0A0L7LHR7_OPEBR|nr:Protein HIRA [Operophtera brumata]
MKLFKPSWVNHNDKPIFSVDIHPMGKRFATGGQGGDSGRVAVWNLNSVLCQTVEMDEKVPKMLCQMDNHLACVNCVRWSNGGRYLASGGDDRLVMVWGLSVAAGGGNLGKGKAETWRCLATLRGHAGKGCTGLGLVTAGQVACQLQCGQHHHHLECREIPRDGLCAERSHGTCEGCCLGSRTTHVLRCSWSPDGQYVLSAHAMNGGGPTAQVVERDGWRCDKDFVGHRKAITCSVYILTSPSSQGTSVRPMDRQIETRTSDGKRRITPVFIPLTQADANCTSPSQGVSSVVHAGPALPAPALGVAGPVVRAAGLLRLQVVNKAFSTQYGTLSRLQLIPNNSASNDPVWETYLGSPVTCIACDAKWASVACLDGTLHVWQLHRQHATRALPPIALMSQAARLTLCGDTLAAVTTSAQLAMWDLAAAHCVIPPLCFRALLSHRGITLTS